MIKLFKCFRWVLPVIITTLAGCMANQTLTEEEQRLAEQREIQARKASDALSYGISHYEAGNYQESENWLSSEEIWLYGSVEQKLESFKYLAFGYCINGLERTCTQAFERAFLTDDTFELSTAERGHPLWDPAFQRAKFIYRCQAAKRMNNEMDKVDLCQ